MDFNWDLSSLDYHVQQPFLFQENQPIGPQSQTSLPQSSHPMLDQATPINDGMLMPPPWNAYSAAPQNNLNDPHSFSNVGEIAAAPMAPPPPRTRKRKAPTLRADDWEPVKSRVIELHITQKLPLQEVKKIVETEFMSSGFSAT